MTPEELVAAGEALYGPGWKPALARDLGLRDEGRLAQMALGNRPIPDGFRREIAIIARERSHRCAELADRLGDK